MFDTYIRLRTCYGSDITSNTAHANFLARVDTQITLNAEMGGAGDADCILWDATLYDYGPHWQRISTLLSELLDDGSTTTEEREGRIADAVEILC